MNKAILIAGALGLMALWAITIGAVFTSQTTPPPAPTPPPPAADRSPDLVGKVEAGSVKRFRAAVEKIADLQARFDALEDEVDARAELFERLTRELKRAVDTIGMNAENIQALREEFGYQIDTLINTADRTYSKNYVDRELAALRAEIDRR